MKTTTKIVFTFSVIFAMLFSINVFAETSAPQLPHMFYGDAKVNGIDLPESSVIIAKVSSTEKGRLATTEVGKYGGVSRNDKKLLVQGGINDDAEIEFFVTNVKANEVAQFKSGKIENKNLSWNFPDVIEFNQATYNTSYTCIPGTNIEVNLEGMTTRINCNVSSVGIMRNISLVGTPTTGSISLFPANLTSPVYEISISGEVDVIVTISYNDAGINESSTNVYKFNGVSWVTIPSSDIISIDTTANKVTFRIPTAGTPYAIFGSTPVVTPPQSPVVTPPQSPVVTPPQSSAPSAGSSSSSGSTSEGDTSTSPRRASLTAPITPAKKNNESTASSNPVQPSTPDISTTTQPEPQDQGVSETSPLTGMAVSKPPMSSNKIVGIIIAILVIATGYGGYYYLYKRS